MKPDLAILLPDLRAGGVEQNFLKLTDEFLRRDLQVEFVLRQTRGEWIESVPKEVLIHSLNAPRVRQAFWPLVRYLRERRPQAVLAAWWPLTSLAVWANWWAGKPSKIVVSDHAMLSQSGPGRPGIPRQIMKRTMRWSYPWAAARIGVSDAVADDIAQLSGMPRSEVTVIGNPITPLPDEQPIDEERVARWLCGKPRLVTVGKLKPVKDQSTLLRVFAKVRKQHPTAQLLVLGEGDERQRIESLAKELEIQEAVTMPGFVDNPHDYVRHADVFVLTSLSEGFGNVLVEALACGVPVVSTDCPGGPRSILADGEFGRLTPVGDEEALAAAIHDTLQLPPNRDALIRRSEDFSISKAADRYLELALPQVGESAA